MSQLEFMRRDCSAGRALRTCVCMEASAILELELRSAGLSHHFARSFVTASRRISLLCGSLQVLLSHTIHKLTAAMLCSGASAWFRSAMFFVPLAALVKAYWPLRRGLLQGLAMDGRLGAPAALADALLGRGLLLLLVL